MRPPLSNSHPTRHWKAARAVRFVYRTRKQGLLPENCRPKAQSRPGSRGTENLFVAIHRGKVLAYQPYTKWNANTCARCWKLVRDRYQEEYGHPPNQVPLYPTHAIVSCRTRNTHATRKAISNTRSRRARFHDRDPSMKSKKSQTRARNYGFQPAWLPARSPRSGGQGHEGAWLSVNSSWLVLVVTIRHCNRRSPCFMPHDYRLWKFVLDIMQAWEAAHPDTKEKPDEYRDRSSVCVCVCVCVCV